MKIRFYLKKEYREIIKCKKIVILLLFSALYPFALNLIATNPIIPMKDALYMALIITACVSAEIIYIVMIEELKSGTFDIVLISGYPAEKIILSKLVVPTVLSGFSVVCALVINGIGTVFVNKAVPISLEVFDAVMLFFVILISELSTFYKIQNTKSYDSKNLTLHVILLVGIFMGFRFLKAYTNLGILISFAILICGALYRLNIYTICHKHRSAKSVEKKGWIQFTGKENTVSRSLRKRNMLRMSNQKFIFFKISGFFLGMLAMNLFPVVSELHREILVIIESYLWITVFVLDCYFDMVKQEVYSRTGEVLLVAGISKRENYSSILRLCMLCGMVTTALEYFLTYLSGRVLGREFLFRGREILSFYGLLFLCLVICQEIVLHGLKSVKEERVVRFGVFITCCVVLIGWYGWLYAGY